MKTIDLEPDSPDRPPILMVTAIIVITFGVVFVSWFFLEAMLNQVTGKFQAHSETGMGNKTRLLYIQEQDDYLKSYATLDHGTYKIPIEEAMKIVIKKENKINELQ